MPIVHFNKVNKLTWTLHDKHYSCFFFSKRSAVYQPWFHRGPSRDGWSPRRVTAGRARLVTYSPRSPHSPRSPRPPLATRRIYIKLSLRRTPRHHPDYRPEPMRCLSWDYVLLFILLCYIVFWIVYLVNIGMWSTYETLHYASHTKQKK